MTNNTEEKNVQIAEFRIIDTSSKKPYVLTTTNYFKFYNLRAQILRDIPFGSLRIECSVFDDYPNHTYTIVIYDEEIGGGTGNAVFYRVKEGGEVVKTSQHLSVVRACNLFPLHSMLYLGDGYPSFPASQLKKITVESYHADRPLFTIKSKDDIYFVYHLEDALPYLKELPYGIRIEFNEKGNLAYYESNCGAEGMFYEVHKEDHNHDYYRYTQCFCESYVPIRMALYEKVLPHIHTKDWQDEDEIYAVSRENCQDQKYIEENCMIDE